MRRTGATIVRIAAAIAVTVGLILTIELACGLYLRAKAAAPRVWAPPVPGTDTVSTTMRSLRGGPVPLVQDLDLLWRNQPGAEKTQPVNPRAFERDDTWTVRDNAEGFRGGERTYKGQDDGVYRILCIGDSVTFGFNVDQDAVFARQLEELLQQRYPTRQFEVINAGTIGWSWVQGLRFLERDGLRLHPNLVIAAHGVNDQYWSARTTDSEHMWLLQNPTVRRFEALNLFLSQTNTYRVLLSRMPAPNRQSEYSPGCLSQVREAGVCHRVSVAEIEQSVREMRRVTAPAGIDLLIANLDFLDTPSVRGSRNAVQKDHIPFLDLVANFKDLRLKDDWRRARQLGLSLPRLPLMRLKRRDGLTEPLRGPRIIFRVIATRPGVAMSMKGMERLGGDFQFDEPMYDDGTHGDEKADDGVFSLSLKVPLGVYALRYQFYQDGAPEFEPLPPYPSSWSSREIRFGDDGTAHMEVFGERFLMAEGVHPNAAGHAVIAAELVKRIEQFESFRVFVGTVAAG